MSTHSCAVFVGNIKFCMDTKKILAMEVLVMAVVVVLEGGICHVNIGILKAVA